MTLNVVPSTRPNKNPPVTDATAAPGREKRHDDDVDPDEGRHEAKVIGIAEGQQSLTIFAQRVKAEVIAQGERSDHCSQKNRGQWRMAQQSGLGLGRGIIHVFIRFDCVALYLRRSGRECYRPHGWVMPGD